MRTAWRKVAALGGAIALGGGILSGLSGSPAAGADPPVFVLPSFPGDLGALRLHLNSDGDFVRFDPSNGAGGYTAGTAQPLTVSGCIASQPAGVPLLLTPTPLGGASQGKLGLVGHSLGVQVKGEGNGTPCGQVNGVGQALDLKLAGTLADHAIDYAELDVEGKFGVTVKAQLLFDGAIVRTETLPTGGPDSGPDSADGDNFRWRLPALSTTVVYFDEIKLTVDAATPSGAFSLEGGSDGTAAQPAPSLGATLATTDSLFHIADVDGTLHCGTSAPTEGGTGGTPVVTISLKSGTDCQDVPYSLSTSNQDGNQAIAFSKLGAPNNIYQADITWPIEASAYPVPPTQIRYSNADPPHALKWCGGTAAAPVPVTGEAWCLFFHQAVPAGDEAHMQVTEKLLGKGDPGYWR
ncbi:MAG: hypothetical protein ABJD24_14655 [Acidimicrobiales bacterium]